MRKTLKLTAAGVLAVVVSLSYLYVFEPRKLYETVRCVTAAQPWYACYLGTEFPFRTDLFGMVYEGRANAGNLVDDTILKHGSYETYVLFFLRDTMVRLNPDNGVFLDVGANSGQHSLFMSRYSKAVHAFEPFPAVLARFRRMLEINNITNVSVHPVGLGREAARLPFDVVEASFSPWTHRDKASMMELEIVAGDTALARAGVVRVDLIKMDIEGYEKPALLGLAGTLRRDRPVVVFELTIDPKRPELFSSEAELREVFPEG
jgi:FkbM family methyltransferase